MFSALKDTSLHFIYFFVFLFLFCKKLVTVVWLAGFESNAGLMRQEEN